MEAWKDSEGYEGLYQVSSLGRVRSLPRASTAGKVLVMPIKNGYPTVCLSKNNEKKTRQVHRLVAEAFISNTQGKTEVNHIDGNKTNNAIENLEWVTRSENESHAYRVLGKNPNRPWAGKPRRFARKLSDEQVREIRADLRPSRIIAKEYGVSKTTVQNIKSYKIYQEVNQ